MVGNCFNCGAEFAEGQKFCRRCGAKLEPATEDRRTSMIGDAQTAGRPLDTNREIADKATRRDLIGDSAQTTPISSSLPKATVQMPPAPKSARRGRLFLVAAAAVAALAIAALMIHYRGELKVAVAPSEGSVSKAPPPSAQPEPPAPAESKPEAKARAQQPESEKKHPHAPKQAEAGKEAAGSAANDGQGASAEAAAPTAADLIKRGLEFFGKKQYDMALADFQEASKLDPTNQDVYYFMGLVYEKLGRPADALESYKRCQVGTYASQSKQHAKRLSARFKD